jgi:hypothetical protein
MKKSFQLIFPSFLGQNKDWSGPYYYAGKENVAGPESHSAGRGVSTPSMITASVSSDSEDCNSRGCGVASRAVPSGDKNRSPGSS